MVEDGPLSRAGHYRKKPSSSAGKPWAASSIQQRYFVTHGYRVEYYARAPAAGAKVKSKGSFDLRAVSSLQPATDLDPSAPEHALEVTVDMHRIVIDFGYRDERDAWLHIWANAVPRRALAADWADAQKHAADDELRAQLEALALSATNEADGGGGSGGGASEVEAVLKEGALWKQGHVRHTWKRRHFRVTSWGNLKYYETSASPKPIDVIALAGCSVFVPKTRRAEYPDAFRLQLDPRFGGKRKYPQLHRFLTVSDFPILECVQSWPAPTCGSQSPPSSSRTRRPERFSLNTPRTSPAIRRSQPAPARSRPLPPAQRAAQRSSRWRRVLSARARRGRGTASCR